MVERVIRLAAIVLSLIVLISFGMFAVDQLRGASRHQQQELAQGQRDAPGTLPQPRRHKQPRRFIDGAAHTLLEPFSGITTSKKPWINRTVPTLIGLLLYGFGLGFLARYARGRA